LYDHRKDSIEYYNLAERPEHAGVREEMVKLLEEGFPVLKK
jgi:hypothetical protein